MSDLQKIGELEARIVLLERQVLSLRKASMLNFSAAVVASTGAVASIHGNKTTAPEKLTKILHDLHQLLEITSDPEENV
ncbi:MAG: hypothetical protein FJX25_10215 [Alphaproteobacteria bacterium]|nr:hypothetical protein [Alphaproteobacteria bacterium]